MLDHFLAANATFVASNPVLPDVPRPAQHLTVLTCMDARIDPLRVLGLSVGDAKILRNAGGRVTEDVIADLQLVVEKLGVTKVLVMHHTGCAAGTKPEDMTVDLARIHAADGLGAVELAGVTYDVATGRIAPNPANG